MGKTASLANIGTIADSSLGFRNRLINGAMVIDQRNAGASVATSSGSVTYTLDRFAVNYTQTSKLTVQQASASNPAGFPLALLVTSSSAYSITSTDIFYLNQRIEGYNVADLAWGTASAATVTLSFWVRSSLTGTFGGSIANSAFNRSYPFSYTISAANTWEQKTITIAGDQSGTWLTTNGVGMFVVWSLGSGSTYSGTAGAWTGSGLTSTTGATSVVGTSGATFYITGVQLEKGSTATSFDYRPYTTELQLCQRYLPAYNGVFQFTGSCFTSGTTLAYSSITLPVQARVAPTGISISSAGHFRYNNSTTNYIATAVTFVASGDKSGWVVLTTSLIASSNLSGQVDCNNASGQLLFTGCEL